MDNQQITKKIATILLEQGVFAISDIERTVNFSRASIKKVLQNLKQKQILKQIGKKGVGVKYKLAVTKQALEFIYKFIQKLYLTDFANMWQVQNNTAQKKLKNFIEAKDIFKIGTPPKKIIYIFNAQIKTDIFTAEQKEIIGKYYTHTTPDGRFLEGITGFLYWAEHKSQRADIGKLAQEYLEIRQKFYQQKKQVILINASDKLGRLFSAVYLKKLFHTDFDALPIFGKTHLSQLIRIAKSGKENKKIMLEIVSKIQDSINEIIKTHQIKAVGFIPPTVARQTQLMTFLAKNLKINLPIIKITKATSLVPVQQKSLRKIEDRILNARETILIPKINQNFSRVLLIDDVTGSGATLNQTAKKLLKQKIAQEVYAFTITGSAKAGGFEVISEA